MNAVRTNFAFRTFVTIVAFFAWVMLSNHCALSAAFSKKASPSASAVPDCCKNQPKPADGDGPCPQLPQGCCKSLKVAMPDAAKVPQVAVTAILPVEEWLAEFTLALPEENSAAPITGPPPDFPAFAELVLNRSLLSHAPPVLA